MVIIYIYHGMLVGAIATLATRLCTEEFSLLTWQWWLITLLMIVIGTSLIKYFSDKYDKKEEVESSKRLKLQNEFLKHLDENPEIADCAMNFLAWLPTSKIGREAIIKMYEEISE